MKITFDGAEKAVRTHSNVGRETTVHRNSESTKSVRAEGFALDISGKVMDNSAYAGHGRTAEEVMQIAGQEDITARRNYMAVMSNTMSDEDFAKLQKEGFNPGSTDIETVVTIVDRIKAALIKGGTQVAGYTDTLDGEQLEAITGSKAFASELQKQFKEYDIPLTEENIDAVVEAFKTMQEIPDLPEGALKYMIENDLDPTAQNLYLARFAGAQDGSRQGQGYYATGGVSGYYARKPESIDYEQLIPQIEKVIEEAGFEISDETIKNAKWMIEKGIPLNETTFSRMQQIESLSFPVSAEDFLKSAAIAISDGTSPSKVDMSKGQSLLEQAVAIEEKVEQLDERAVDIISAKNLPFHLKNLFAAFEEIRNNRNTEVQADDADHSKENLRGRRLLEEIRLTMTVSANLKLLRSGYNIETAPMEELIDRLKSAESDLDKTLVQETDAQAAKEKRGLYQQTLYILKSIGESPAKVAADVSKEDTLPQVEAKGKALEAEYKKAESSYETLMTAPGKDMGDSIKKAFRNVDDILIDMDKELTEQNRKTVRILGYNSMEMTEENFERIRQSEAILADVINKMKPGRVLSMIREGVNPLTMTLEELNQYLDSKEDPQQELESYSRFLYKLDQKKGITEEERSAYIGIYRLLRQVEKGDDAALGAVVQSGAGETLENLLTAVRSSKKKHMDYHIGDDFGGVSAKTSDVESITQQVEKGFLNTRQDLEAAIEDEDTEKAEAQFRHSLYEEVRNAAGSEEAVLRQLMDYNQPVTADFLMAAGEMQKGLGENFQRFKKLLDKNGNENELPKMSAEKMTDTESTQKAYEELANEWQEIIEETALEREGSSLDVRAMNSIYKQITFMKSMAKEENYTMPVEIGGELTEVNLKVIHKNGEDSKVSITLETELLGKNVAEFSFTEAGLSGYGVCSNKQGSKLLAENEETFSSLLDKEDILAGDVHFAVSADLNLEEYSLKISKDRIAGQTPDTLYKAAKVYIEFVQDTSRKGSI